MGRWRRGAGYAHAVAVDAGQVDQPKHPDLLARVVATALISTVTGTIIGKLLGRNAGFAAFVLAAAAHEALDAPLARTLSDLGV
jgi:hypothetical protein